MQPITIPEWGSELDVPLTFEQLKALERVAGKALTITPGSRRDTWNLRAQSEVGAIRIGDLTVHVRPKVPLENLFRMLTVGQDLLRFPAGLVGFEGDELLPALASFYQRLLADTLARGPIRAYREHHETLVALRGRIDVPALLRTGGMPAPIPCRFDDRSLDIPEHRILRTAALHLAAYPEVHPRVRHDLRRAVGVLEGVGTVDPRAIPTVHLTRLTEHYAPVLALAEVVLRSGGIRDRAGGRDAGAFLIDMNTLFERWVTVEVRRHLDDRYVVHGQYGAHLDVGRKVSMRPDIVVERRGRPVLVADVKYKVSGDGLARTADYYQLLAYCTALGLDEGVLIYATADGAAPSTITVAGSGVRLRVVRWPLDAIGDTAPLVDELGLGSGPVRLAV